MERCWVYAEKLDLKLIEPRQMLIGSIPELFSSIWSPLYQDAARICIMYPRIIWHDASKPSVFSDILYKSFSISNTFLNEFQFKFFWAFNKKKKILSLCLHFTFRRIIPFISEVTSNYRWDLMFHSSSCPNLFSDNILDCKYLCQIQCNRCISHPQSHP